MNDTFSQVLIVCQDKTGNAFSSTHALNGAVEVISGLNQQVSAQMVSGDLLLTVSSSASDPIVEAKQHKRKRRYVVSNSGPIETVRINGTKVCDTGPNGTLPAGANRPVLYKHRADVAPQGVQARRAIPFPAGRTLVLGGTGRHVARGQLVQHILHGLIRMLRVEALQLSRDTPGQHCALASSNCIIVAFRTSTAASSGVTTTA